MKEKLKILKYTINIIFLITVVLWIVFIYFTNNSALYEGPIFEYVLKPFLVGMTLLPLLGGILGMLMAKSWGGWKSTIGKSLISLSLGMFGWAGGMMFWNYYLFFTNVEVPYPSLGDLFYIMIWPCWTYGMIQLSKATGAKYGFKKVSGKTVALILSLLVIIVSYYLLFKVARQGYIDLSGGLISNILAVLYPLGDLAILLSSLLVFSLSYKFLGGVYRISILILIIGFILNYIADVIFVFGVTSETYFNGNIADFLYVVMLFTVFSGISKLNPNYLIKDKK